jgi:hypothetical protein
MRAMRASVMPEPLPRLSFALEWDLRHAIGRLNANLRWPTARASVAVEEVSRMPS